jgi:peroxiredoxin
MLFRSSIPQGMVFATLLLGGVHPVSAGKFNEILSIDDAAPAWPALPGIDGKTRSLRDFDASSIVVLAFISNKCPVASGYEPRFKQFVTDYRDRGVAFVAISVSQSPVDNFEKMQARATERQFNFPYLFDPSQVTGRRYGATNTPHLFVLNRERKIAYMGAYDDSPDAAGKVQEAYVRSAVEALLAGKPVEIRETRQRGCEIEYADETP